MVSAHRLLASFGLAGVGLALSATASGAAPPTFAPREIAATNLAAPVSAVIGDLNRDGRPDLASVNPGGEVSVVLRNAANTGWEAVQNVAVGGAPYSVAVGDLNGDGRADIATGDARNNRVNVVLRNAAGTGWDAPQNAGSAGGGPYSVAIGDLNGDGRPDLATGDLGGARVTVIQRNAAGTGWDPPQNAGATGGNPRSVVIGDLNGDNRADLATADQSSDRVTVILRNATNTGWQTPENAGATGPSPGFLAIGDLNDDGRADLATADDGGNGVTVLQRNATGTGWDPPQNAGATGSRPFSVAIGDLDGDGRPDLVTADSSSNQATVIQRNAAGTGWEAPRSAGATGSRPSSAAIGDLDGDGRPDLATADQASGTISVLRNTTDLVAPTSTDDVPAVAASLPVTVTLQATDNVGGSGVAEIRYRVVDADGSLGPVRVYNAAAKPTLGAGERLEYQAVDNAGNEEPARRSNIARSATSPTTDTGSGGSGNGNGPTASPPPGGSLLPTPAAVVKLRGVRSSRSGRQLAVTFGSSVPGTVEAIATHDGPGGRSRALTPGRGRIVYAKSTPRRVRAGRLTVRLARTTSATRALRRYTRRDLRLRVTVRFRPAAGGRPIERITNKTVRVR